MISNRWYVFFAGRNVMQRTGWLLFLGIAPLPERLWTRDDWGFRWLFGLSVEVRIEIDRPRIHVEWRSDIDEITTRIALAAGQEVVCAKTQTAR